MIDGAVQTIMTKEELISRLLTQLHITSNNDILELCCKNTKGELGKEFCNICSYFGIDSDIVFIDKMRRNNPSITKCSYFHVESDSLKFQNKVFNCVFVVMIDKKEDIKKLYSMLKESIRVTHDDGRIGIFSLSNDQLIKLQAYAQKHFGHIELNSKDNGEGKFDLIIKKVRKQ